MHLSNPKLTITSDTHLEYVLIANSAPQRIPGRRCPDRIRNHAPRLPVIPRQLDPVRRADVGRVPARDDSVRRHVLPLGQLGPEWQYVMPNGIITRGDTTYIGTADGIKLTWDDGQTWRVITDSIGATTAGDSLWGRVSNQYILEMGVAGDRELWITQVHGREASLDGGRTWHPGLCCRNRISRPDSVFLPQRIHRTAPAASGPGSPRHTWFRRPIALTAQPYIDQTYRFGSTMGGNFQPHQGVEFNNADGTPVHAIGAGVVVHSGPAERGALTVAIKHDARLTTHDARLFVYSVYYHNSQLLVQVGQRVKAGDVIALVGNTGRATNDHLHLEVHASPFDSTRLIVDPDVRYPPYNTNPELWIDPLPGTGMIAGQVWDSAGQPVYQARRTASSAHRADGDAPLPRAAPRGNAGALDGGSERPHGPLGPGGLSCVPQGVSDRAGHCELPPQQGTRVERFVRPAPRVHAALPPALGRCSEAPGAPRTVGAGRLRGAGGLGRAPGGAAQCAHGRDPLRRNQRTDGNGGAADSLVAVCQREGAAAHGHCARRRGRRRSRDVALARRGAPRAVAGAPLRGGRRRARTSDRARQARSGAPAT